LGRDLGLIIASVGTIEWTTRQHASRKFSTRKKTRGKGRDMGRGKGEEARSKKGIETHLNSTEEDKERKCEKETRGGK